LNLAVAPALHHIEAFGAAASGYWMIQLLQALPAMLSD
jgi:hypothetical protein